MNIDKLREQLKIDEGVKYQIYNDHLGYATFGIGHLITPKDPEHNQPVGTEISEERVNEAFDKDVELFINESKKIFPDFDDKPEEVKQVVVNMCFNLGEPRLSQFKKFIAAINEKDWDEAAHQMMDSKWANQVGERAKRLARRILDLKH